MKEHNYKVGDVVRIVKNDYTYANNQSRLKAGDTFTINELSPGGFLRPIKNEPTGVHVSLCELVKNETSHKIGDWFCAINAKDAKEYIGKVVEFADGNELPEWKHKDKLTIIDPVPKSRGHCFNGFYEFIRLCKESFETKPDHTGLIEVLEKKAIPHWELMAMTIKSKRQCYEFLGGVKDNTCFLCDYVKGCKSCISWGKGAKDCDSSGTVYYNWDLNPTPKNTQAVIDHMESELKRLKAEMK